MVALALLAHGGDLRDRFLRLVMGPLPEAKREKAIRMADSFFEGLGVFRNRSDLIVVSTLSVVAWLFEASVYWTVAHAFGGDLAAVMGVPEALLTTGIANLATLIPSSPGYVGPFEAAIILVLSGALDLPRELALSYGVLLHGLLYFPVTIWGIIELSRMQLSLRQVEKLAEDGQRSSRIATSAQSRTRGVTSLVANRGHQMDLLQAIVLGITQGLPNFCQSPLPDI